MEDRSLDEFLDTGSDEEDAGDPSEEESPDSDQDGDDASEDSPEERAAVDSADEKSVSDPLEDTDTSTERSDDESRTGDEPTPDSTATDDVEPAVSTFVRTPDGDSCAACGATVERRWYSDDGLVCADCKEW